MIKHLNRRTSPAYSRLDCHPGVVNTHYTCHQLIPSRAPCRTIDIWNRPSLLTDGVVLCRGPLRDICNYLPHVLCVVPLVAQTLLTNTLLIWHFVLCLMRIFLLLANQLWVTLLKHYWVLVGLHSFFCFFGFIGVGGSHYSLLACYLLRVH